MRGLKTRFMIEKKLDALLKEVSTIKSTLENKIVPDFIADKTYYVVANGRVHECTVSVEKCKLENEKGNPTVYVGVTRLYDGYETYVVASNIFETKEDAYDKLEDKSL